MIVVQMQSQIFDPGQRVTLASRVNRLLHGLPPSSLILLSILSIQLSSALATQLFLDLGPIGTTASSTAFAAIALTLITRPRIDRRLLRHAGLIFGFGLIDAGMALPFFLALQYIPLGIASTIAFCGPLGLAIVTSRRPIDFLWIAIALLGVALMAPAMGGGLNPLGLGLAALSAIAWALFVLMAKRLGRTFQGSGNRCTSDGLAFGMWAASLILLPIAFYEGTMLRIFELGFGAIPAMAGSCLVALLNVVLPLSLEFQALQRMSARSYGVLVTLEPAFGALIGLVWLGQAIGLRGGMAICCVTVAALGVTLTERSGNKSI